MASKKAKTKAKVSLPKGNAAVANTPKTPAKQKKKNHPLRPQPAWLFPPDEENPILNPKNKSKEQIQKEIDERLAAIKFLEHKSVTAPVKTAPPIELLQLIGAFFASYGFVSTGRIFSLERNARKKLDGWNDEIGEKRFPKNMPDLVKIFKDWRADWEGDSDAETSSSGEDSEEDIKTKDAASESDSSDTDSDNESSNSSSTLKGNSPAKELSSSSVSSSSESSSDSGSSSSDTDADSTPAVKSTKRKASSPSAAATPNSSTLEDSGPQSTKRTKVTSEPFTRVPKDTKVDPKLASNKYISYDYADRAHQDLVVTKGKGFTKEKNKKKRGS